MTIDCFGIALGAGPLLLRLLGRLPLMQGSNSGGRRLKNLNIIGGLAPFGGRQLIPADRKCFSIPTASPLQATLLYQCLFGRNVP
jgi:hypothetical protein